MGAVEKSDSDTITQVAAIGMIVGGTSGYALLDFVEGPEPSVM